MEQSRTSCITPQSLTLHWTVWGKMLVAFARYLLRLEQAKARGTLRKAEMLELWSFSAAVNLTRDIASLEVSHSAADRQAAMRLQVIATALVLLAMFAQRLQARLLAHADAVGDRASADGMALMHAASAPDVPYLDSG